MMQSQLPSTIPTYVREKIPDAIVPVVFAEAIRAIAACRSIDEGKYWSDKADALAAWAKVYKQNETAIEARRLKAHAFRRMSRLADELAEAVRDPRRPGRVSPKVQLTKAGLSNSQITKIRQVGAVPEKKFNELVAGPNPPHIGRLAFHGVGTKNKLASSDAWRRFAGGKYVQGNGHKFRQFCRAHSAYELGRGISPDEVIVAKKFVQELRDWLDEFIESMPQEAPLP
jgi:hypothetical protein